MSRHLPHFPNLGRNGTRKLVGVRPKRLRQLREPANFRRYRSRQRVCVQVKTSCKSCKLPNFRRQKIGQTISLEIDAHHSSVAWNVLGFIRLDAPWTRQIITVITVIIAHNAIPTARARETAHPIRLGVPRIRSTRFFVQFSQRQLDCRLRGRHRCRFSRGLERRHWRRNRRRQA